MADEALPGWAVAPFTAAGITRPVPRRGSGPAVVVIHELPGITPTVIDFADEVVDAGFTVAMPQLVGTPGKERGALSTLTSLAQVCIAREFTTWALERTSPIVSWLRALARSLHLEVGGPGAGAVGMCFSGGFALGMMVDDVMVAPVVSQPAMPFAIGGAARKADLNLSPDDRLVIGQRAADGCEVLGLRFVADRMVGTRFDSLRDLLGGAFIAVELPSPTKRAHSVLTEHRDDAAVRQVIDFLSAKLHPTP